MEINLLPIELSPSRGAAKFAKTLNRITIIVTGIFLFISLVGVIFIVFFSIQIGSSVTKQTTLKSNIQSLEGTEQKLFLIKDRIDKIKFALASKNAEDALEIMVNQPLSNLPSTVSVNSVQIDSTTTKFSVLSTDSLGMATFLNTLVTSGIYKNLTLTSFVFNPERGYVITLEIS